VLNLIRRLWPMHHDLFAHGRHRGRPALVARRHSSTDVLDADGRPWSPQWEVDHAPPGQPEELPEEAVVREAEEIVDHWAAEYQRYADEVRGWFDEIAANDPNPLAAQLLAEARERVARKASVAAADALRTPTGAMPVLTGAVS
jgi:hypothetical protein